LLSQQVEANTIDCQWQRQGFYHTAADSVALREHTHYLHYLDTLEIEHRVLDRAILSEHLGTEVYQAGIHIADGALMQPAALVRGLADSLPANVRLHEQSPVLGIGMGTPLTLSLDQAQVRTWQRITSRGSWVSCNPTWSAARWPAVLRAG
jgi:glycine/D-amino acid oxidase-like deaminating enzyme